MVEAAQDRGGGGGGGGGGGEASHPKEYAGLISLGTITIFANILSTK
jgi:hypothetical protein